MPRRRRKKKYLNNCEICDECLYICEGDFICDKFDVPVLVKTDWTPTKYYDRCEACKNAKEEKSEEE